MHIPACSKTTNEITKSRVRDIRRVFFGWWIVRAGCIATALSSGLFFTGFGFFFEPIRIHFGWSRTIISGAYGVSRIESSILGPFLGYLIQKIGPRLVMFIAFVIFGLGYIIISRANSVVMFYAGFVVLATGADPPSFISVMTRINNWFFKNRAKAIGFTMLGLGIGGVVFPPILAFGLNNFTWQSVALTTGIFVAIVGGLVSLFIRSSPEPYGYLPDGVQEDANLNKPSVPEMQRNRKKNTPLIGIDNFALLDALKTKAFWVISIGHAQALLVVSSTGIHQVPYLENSLGFSKTSAAFAVMLLTSINMIGQLSGGILANKFPKRKLAAYTILGHTLAILSLALATSTLHIVGYAIIQGLSWGARTPVLTSMRGDYFGRTAFASIMGTSQSIAMVGMIIGPLIVGYCADHYSYELGFYLISALTAPGFLLLLSLDDLSPQS